MRRSTSMSSGRSPRKMRWFTRSENAGVRNRTAATNTSGSSRGNGIHDIHMNQGNSEEFMKDDGVWQDGSMLLHLPSEDRWVAAFLAFQSQCWHTDDSTGHCIGDPEQPAEDKGVVIIAATVNPAGDDPGMERVLLLNTLAI